jgi:DNA polymerase
MVEAVARHRDPARWSFSYSVLWRLTHGEPGLLDVVTDDDVYALLRMEREVRRDLEAMKGEIRFRRFGQGAAAHYAAWYQPAHRILELVAPYFQRRFGVITWSVVTPDASIHWNGEELRWGDGAPETPSSQSAPGGSTNHWWHAVGRSLATGSTEQATVGTASRGYRQPSLPMPRALSGSGRSLDWPPDTSREFRLAPQPQRRSSLATSAEEYLPDNTDNLTALSEAAEECRGCELCKNATQTVFGAGPQNARIVFVGEQPGDHEDRRGKPFVGPAGKLLDDVLNEVGIDRDKIYVTNAVKHFKWTARGKRRLHGKPTAREVAACRPWLEAELLAIRPQLLVCMGATAVASLLGAGHRLTKEHGRVFASEWAPETVVTYHPSAILRAQASESGPELRALFVDDMKQVARAMRRTPK